MSDFLRNWGKTEHEKNRELLSAYLDDELTPEEVTQVERHLAECEACQTEVESLQWTVGLLQEVPAVPAPQSFIVRQADLEQPEKVFLPDWVFGYMKTATVVAAFVLMMLVSGDLLFPYLPGGAAEPAPASLQMAEERAVASPASEATVVVEKEIEKEEPKAQMEAAQPEVEAVEDLTATPEADASEGAPEAEIAAEPPSADEMRPRPTPASVEPTGLRATLARMPLLRQLELAVSILIVILGGTTGVAMWSRRR